jgi:predicted RNA-binding protein YlqC (UPF0109 family)
MKKLLEYLVTSIVEHPQDVVIEEKEEEGQLNLNLQVHPQDVKIVIGKQGKTIKSIREIIKIKSHQRKKKG